MKFVCTLFTNIGNYQQCVVLQCKSCKSLSNAYKNKFLCVKFDIDGTTDVIPREWMCDEKTCKWPSNAGNVRELAKRSKLPMSDWLEYSCAILCQASM